MSGGGPGRRAVLRWAWRSFRRDWRQQVLMLALLTVAVAAAVGMAAVAVNAASDKTGFSGDAAGAARLRADRPDVEAQLSALRARYGAIEVIPRSHLEVPGSVEQVDVRAQDPDGRLGHSMLAVRAGRYPRTAGEVALTDGAAELLDADLGDRIAVHGVERTVVGRVENPADLDDEFALLPPGDATGAEQLFVLLQSTGRPAGSTTASGAPGPLADVPIMVAGDDTAAVSALVLVASTIALSLVSLVAAAGFLVVAQRRQRQLGLLAALGATERHLRLVLVANGAFVGLVAAAVGGALGIVGWMVAAPAVETAAGHRIDRFDLPWVLVAECLALAVTAATAAAWWPGRTMARQPVMVALARRPGRPLPVRRSTALALALAVGGIAAISQADPTTEHVRPWFLVGGTFALVAGVVLAAPLGIRALRAPAGHLPLPARLALRDLVRYQARAAAALAAITLALGLSVGAIVLAQANEYRSDEGNLSDRQLVVERGNGPRPVGDRSALDDGAAVVAQAIGEARLVPLDTPMVTFGDGTRPLVVTKPMDDGYRGVGLGYVATPELLAAYGIDPQTIRPDADILTASHEPLFLLDERTRPRMGQTSPTQHVSLPAWTSAPRFLVTEAAVARHGWTVDRQSWLLEAAQPLTSDQLAAARQAADEIGLRVEARSTQDALATLRTVGTAVGVVLALAILAMTVGLVRGESAADLRTLTATGAAPGTRRALTASTAAALAVLGAVLGIGGAYLALVAAYQADLGELASPPITQLLVLAVGMPAVAAAGGWLLAGREPSHFARQALD